MCAPASQRTSVRCCVKLSISKAAMMEDDMHDLLTVTDAEAADKIDERHELAPSPLIREALKSSARHIPWGRDPHDPPKAGWRAFQPRYLAILYLRLEQGWEISVNHACFTVDDPDDDDLRRAKAVNIVSAKVAAGVELGDASLRQFGTYRHQLPGAGHDPMRPFDSGSFADFNFLSQNELFIYLDDPDIRLEAGDLIAFKAVGNGPHPKNFNYSYFHAREVPRGEMNGLPGKMIRVRNYATLEDGTEIPPTENRYYSMDIKFRISGGSAGMITMIIDPDTGNGQGNEP